MLSSEARLFQMLARLTATVGSSVINIAARTSKNTASIGVATIGKPRPRVPCTSPANKMIDTIAIINGQSNCSSETRDAERDWTGLQYGIESSDWSIAPVVVPGLLKQVLLTGFRFLGRNYVPLGGFFEVLGYNNFVDLRRWEELFGVIQVNTGSQKQFKQVGIYVLVLFHEAHYSNRFTE